MVMSVPYRHREAVGRGDPLLCHREAVGHKGDTHNLPCIADAHQHGSALGVGKRSECLNHFFLKAAFEFNSRTFSLPDRVT